MEPSANWRKVSQAQAAEMLGVSPRSVQRAKTVLEKGTPELLSKVERGEMAVSAAAKSLLPEPPSQPRPPLREKVDAMMAEQEARFGPIDAKPLSEEHRRALMPMRALTWLRQLAAERISVPALAPALRDAIAAIEPALAGA